MLLQISCSAESLENQKVQKRQDPSLIRGMATVDKELPTHLYRELNIFGLLTGVTPSRKE